MIAKIKILSLFLYLKSIITRGVVKLISPLLENLGSHTSIDLPTRPSDSQGRTASRLSILPSNLPISIKQYFKFERKVAGKVDGREAVLPWESEGRDGKISNEKNPKTQLFSSNNNVSKTIRFPILFLLSLLFLATKCDTTKEIPKVVDDSKNEQVTTSKTIDQLQVGAEQLDNYLSKIKNKNVALLVNQTSVVGEEHLVDVLLKNNISIKKIFAPEHGFRGQADAGEKVKDGKDAKTGIPLISLYGKNKKPTAEYLSGIDLVIFDIQDVGARFYTYISSMSYVMEACAENNVDFMVLDRPNPNGHYIDGPVLKSDYSSFVGLHPIPVVHGMTVGEYAQMVNGEGWLKNGVKCNLSVMKCANYDHQTFYDLPIKPSPNLPNIRSIYLYPSLCFFEGTTASVGRGTNTQFQVIGHPDFQQGDYNFTPVKMEGAKYPKHENKKCNGYNLSALPIKEFQEHGQINLNYLIGFYNNFPNKKSFFLENKFFDKLAGSATLRWQIINKKSEEEIRQSWQNDLNAFQKIRKKYLLYKDFE